MLGILRVSLVTGIALVVGCGERGILNQASVFNPAFVNYTVGGIVPLVPGVRSGFVLVRVVNNTDSNIRFVVTAERQIAVTDDQGVTTVETIKETRRLQTIPESLANDIGVLFECPVLRVGLGENIDFPTTEPGLFLDAVVGEQEGFGVPGNVFPLNAEAGNFACGDTLIFQASTTAGTVGNVSVVSLRLDASEQPTEVAGPDTFNNFRTVLEQFTLEEE